MAKNPVLKIGSTFDDARRAWIYCAAGKLIGSEVCYDFLDTARGRIDDRAPHVVIDMSGVTMLNSTGIGIVASLCASTDKVGGKVYLAGASASVERPLTATHMWGMISRCESLGALPEDL
jgi:anti-anti-sigma factor